MLEQSGLEVTTCLTEEQFFENALTTYYQAVIIRHTGSWKSLVEHFKRWQAQGATSRYMVITRRSFLTERAKALAEGILYYYIEPCSYAQIVADIRADSSKVSTLRSTYFELDINSQTVYFKGTLLSLTRIQYAVLYALLRRPGIVLSRLQIWEEVWGYGKYPADNTVDVHIYRLRQKLHDEAGNLIKTVHGMGYVLADTA